MNIERSIPNNDPQQLPFSPKKKLHTKDKCNLADTITNARASLKNGKDISARNLMECPLRKPPPRGPSFEFDPNLAIEGSESTTEEIIALDEEHTDFLSTRGGNGFNDDEFDDDDEETIVEEVFEEYYEEELVVDDDDDDDDRTEGSLEPLPPPIVIPKSLRVKDSDNEDDDDSDDDDSDDDEDESLPSKVVPPKKPQPITANIASSRTAVVANPPKVVAAHIKKEKKLPNSDVLIKEKASNLLTMIASPVVAVPTSKATVKSDGTAEKAPSGDFDDEIDRKTANISLRIEDDATGENDKSSSSIWEKPDWTMNNRLKATGVSPARNLAKPITVLPDLVIKKQTIEMKTPKKSNTIQKKLSLDHSQIPTMMTYPKSPQLSSAKVSVASMNAPKSAPQPDGGRKKYVVPTIKDDSGNNDSNDDDEFSSKIAWEKPEWAKKKVLRKTSKTETILSGGKLERPIGGIRPI